MGSRGRRRALRWRVVALAACIALGPLNASASAPSRKTFQAETDGSPRATIYGSWNEEDPSPSNSARLSIDGGHATGRFTRFEAVWVTPPSTSSKQPTLTMAHDVAYSSAMGSATRLIQSVRARFPRGGWGKWVRQPIVLSASGVDDQSEALRVVVPLSEPDRVIFQWKVTGRLSSPAAITGDFELSVS